MSPGAITIISDAAERGGLPRPLDTAVAIGNFDGVHRGHRQILAEVVREARARSLLPAVLTFDPHPSAILGKGAPPVLTSLPRKIELLLASGVEHVFVRRFDAAFATWSAERFVEELLRAALGAKVVVVGENFRFGAERRGDLGMLRALGTELGFDAHVQEVDRDSEGAFSSTRARRAIAAGDIAAATEVLGRPHAIEGKVVLGDKRGRTIGFPTANLADVAEMVPSNGVYAVRVEELLGGGVARALGPGVMNIGVRPTVHTGAPPTLEVHLLDLSRDLYRASLRVSFVARLRDEQRFAGLDALKAQIARDVEAARVVLGRFP